MKALVKSHAKEGIWLEDVSEPDVGNNDVLIRYIKQQYVAQIYIFIIGMIGQKKLFLFL